MTYDTVHQKAFAYFFWANETDDCDIVVLLIIGNHVKELLWDLELVWNLIDGENVDGFWGCWFIYQRRFAGLIEYGVVGSDDFITFEGSHDWFLLLYEEGEIVVGH